MTLLGKQLIRSIDETKPSEIQPHIKFYSARIMSFWVIKTIIESEMESRK